LKEINKTTNRTIEKLLITYKAKIQTVKYISGISIIFMVLFIFFIISFDLHSFLKKYFLWNRIKTKVLRQGSVNIVNYNMTSNRYDEAEFYNVLKAVREQDRQINKKFYKIFKECKPNLNENASIFGLKLELLLDKACPNLRRSKREALLKKQFINYLPKDIQQMLLISGVKRWKETLKKVDYLMGKF
jgi:hypothetical protein